MHDTEVNIPLLRKVVEWAEAEAAKPEALCEWEQGSWVIPASSADRETWGGWDRYVTADYGKAQECGTCYCIAGYTVASTVGAVPARDIPHEARKALGLSLDQSDVLFEGSNAIADIRRIAEDIAGERL